MWDNIIWLECTTIMHRGVGCKRRGDISAGGVA